MAKILLTGSTGFIGKYLLKLLETEQHDISTWEKNRDGNFNDSRIREKVLTKYKPQIVVHLAWPSLQKSEYTKDETHISFARETCDFLNTCTSKGARFISLGTVFERSTLDDANKYGIGKKLISDLISSNPDLDATWLVPSYIFSFEEEKPRLLGEISRISQPISTILKNPNLIQNWIEVRDVALALNFAINSNLRGVYNIESRANVTVKDFAEHFVKYQEKNSDFQVRSRELFLEKNTLFVESFTRLYLE